MFEDLDRPNGDEADDNENLLSNITEAFLKQFEMVSHRDISRPPAVSTISEESLRGAGVTISTPGPSVSSKASKSRVMYRQLRLSWLSSDAYTGRRKLKKLMWSHAEAVFHLILQELEDSYLSTANRSLMAIVTRRLICNVGVSRVDEKGAAVLVEIDSGPVPGDVGIQGAYQNKKVFREVYDDLYGVSGLHFIVFPVEHREMHVWRFYKGIDVCNDELDEIDDFNQAVRWQRGNGSLRNTADYKNVTDNVSTGSETNAKEATHNSQRVQRHLDYVDVTNTNQTAPFVDIDIRPFLSMFASKQCKLAAHYRKKDRNKYEKTTRAVSLLRSALRKCCFESTIRAVYDLSGCYRHGIGVQADGNMAQVLRYCAKGMRRNYDTRDWWLRRLAMEIGFRFDDAPERSLGAMALLSRWRLLVSKDERSKDPPQLSRDDFEKKLPLIQKEEENTGINANGKRTVMTAALKGHGDKRRSIREYVDRADAEAGSPRMLSMNKFLMRLGGMNTRIVPVGASVPCMLLTPDGNRVACGCVDGLIVILNVLRSEIEKMWKAHENAVLSIAVDREGRRIVSGSKDGTVRVWEVGTFRCLSTFEGHSRAVRCIAVLNDDIRVVSGSDDGTIQIWNMETGRKLSQLSTCDTRIMQVQFAVLGDGEYIVSGGFNNKLCSWNVTSGAQADVAFEGHSGPVTCLAETRDGRRIVSGSWDRSLKIWDVQSQKQVGDSLKGHRDWVQCVGVSGDGSRIVSGSYDNTTRVWDSESGKQICDPLEGHIYGVTGVSFLADRESIVSCSYDGTVRVWDTRRKKSERVGDRHENVVSSVSFTPDGKLAVSGSWDGTLRVWDTTSGQQVGDQLKGHTDWVTDVAVTPNGRWVVSFSDNKTVFVWDLQSRELLHTLTDHTDWIYCVAVTPKGDSAVTGSDDETVRVWDLTAMDGNPVVLEGHHTSVMRVFVTDDGLRVVSVDRSDNIFVWELKMKTIVKRVTEKYAWTLSRRKVLDLVGETTVQDNTALSIPLGCREIKYGGGSHAQVLATLEADVACWALSPNQKTICVGLEDGQVVFYETVEVERVAQRHRTR